MAARNRAGRKRLLDLLALGAGLAGEDLRARARWRSRVPRSPVERSLLHDRLGETRRSYCRRDLLPRHRGYEPLPIAAWARSVSPSEASVRFLAQGSHYPLMQRIDDG